MFDPLSGGGHRSVGSILEQDHERIDEHLARFPLGPAAEADTCQAGSAGPGHHLHLEEQHPFPTLGAPALLAPMVVMLREPGQIWDLLDTLEVWPGDEGPAAAPAETWAVLTSLSSDLTPHGRVWQKAGR